MMGEKEVTRRFHVYPDPAEAHNAREPELVANENKANPLRWIDPRGHEAWPGSGSEAMTLQEGWAAVFGPSVDAYNAKQKRKDRKETLDGYFEKVLKDTRGRTNKAVADANKRTEAKGRYQDMKKEKGKHPSYEVVLSLGKVGHRMPEDIALQVYRRYVEDWPKRNPNFYLYRVDYHDGEWFRSKDGQKITDRGGPPGKWSKGVPHPHLSFIPFADGFTTGLARQCNVGQALRSMGCDGWQEWQERERAYIAELAAEYGYTVVRVREDEQRDEQYSTEEYQALADALAELADEARDLAAKEEDLEARGRVMDGRRRAVKRREDDVKVREDAAAVRERELASSEKRHAETVRNAQQELEATRTAIWEAQQERDTIQLQALTAQQDLDDQKEQIGEEIRTYRDGLIAKAEADARDREAKIIQDAKDEAADIRAAATGEHAFLVDFFGKKPFIIKKEGPDKGKSWLDIARSRYERQLRNERLKAMPDSVKDAGKSQPDGLGGPTGHGA